MCGNCFVYCPDAAIAQRGDWGFEIDLDYCKGCGVCVQECPRSAMSMIPEEET
jgi:2-oxoacid:acceptor oxidoreductase delta subunit (pyruvate/2-ketoisovalerate family)